MSALRLALTPGEPAGIGPDLAVMLAQSRQLARSVVVVADPAILQARARLLGLPFRALPMDESSGAAGEIACRTVESAQPVEPGRLDPCNAGYVLETLRIAAEGCLSGRFAGMTTGPVHKGVINEAGFAFSGHTEYLAARAGVERVVMMLVADTLRVALATTHIPLAQVPAAITRSGIESALRVVHADLHKRFGIVQPRIAVLGLNPHAGEGGHLGREELDAITPALDALRKEGIRVSGPLAADTAFVPERLAACDVVFAMYHDQGLPVLKYAGFGAAVNVTLGLPFVRTSVDHGVALDCAGNGRASDSSLRAAVAMAQAMAAR